MTIVRNNLLTRPGYTPYCGAAECRTMPRTVFNGKQFECKACGWQSAFEAAFMKQYKDKWGYEKTTDELSRCVVCGEAFKEGDELQAFLRSPDDPAGSWTTPVEVDCMYQERSKRNRDKIKRKHSRCKP